MKPTAAVIGREVGGVYFSFIEGSWLEIGSFWLELQVKVVEIVSKIICLVSLDVRKRRSIFRNSFV